MEKVSGARIALKWGLILGLITIIYSTIAYNTDLWKVTWIGMVTSFLFIFIVLYMSMKEFKLLNNGFMSFGEGFGVGMLISTTSGIISMAFDFVYKKFIDPTLIEQTIEVIREQYESMGMAEDKIEEAIEKVSQMQNSGLSFIFGILGILVIGLVCSLIMAAIMKKEKSIFE